MPSSSPPAHASNLAFVAGGAGAASRQVQDKLRERPSVGDFWSVVHADDTASFRNAALLGCPIEVPWRPAAYSLSGTVNLIDGTVFYGVPGARPQINWNSASNARIFDAEGRTACGLVNLSIDGNKALAPASTSIRYRDCVRAFAEDLYLSNMPGSSTGCVVLSGTSTRCKLRRIDFTSPGGTGIGLSGVSWNRVEDIEVYGDGGTESVAGTGGFGVRLGEGASFNRVQNVTGYDTHYEAIGLAYGCNYNLINGHMAYGTGDNGVSVSGDYNTVSAGISYRCDKAGIGVWGSNNTVANNVLVSNDQLKTGTWAGLWIDNGYGGLGSYNVGIGNIIDDDQAVMTQNFTVRIPGNAYVLWAEGQVVTPGTYRYYGLNVYRCDQSGTTGATAPVHTSGTASDGGVNWLWMSTARSFLTPRVNFIAMSGNGGRSKSGQGLSDASSWTNNQLFGYGVNTRYANYPTSAAGLLPSEVYVDASGFFKRVTP